MKRLACAALLLSLSLSACSTETKPQALTSALTVKLDGVTQANLTLKNASDKVVFDGLIEQEKVIRDLSRDVYTLTGAAVDTRVAQMRIVDLRQGDQTTTVSYVEQRAQLTLQVYGVAQAPVTVRDEKGTVVFDGPISGTQAIPTLTIGTYTVTPGPVVGQTTPGIQTVRVNGATTVTLSYAAAAQPLAVLTVQVTGPAAAPIEVSQDGQVFFAGLVSGNLVLPNLPRGLYTLRAGSVTGFDLTTPVTTIDLSSGKGSARVDYLPLAGQEVVAGRLRGQLAGWNFGQAYLPTISFEERPKIDTQGNIDTLLIPYGKGASGGFDSDNCEFVSGDRFTATVNFFEKYTAKTGYSDNLGDIYQTLVNRSQSRVMQLYSDRSATLNATYRCDGRAFTFQNVPVRRDWNALSASVDDSANAVRITPLETGARAQLMFTRAPEKFSLNFYNIGEIFRGQSTALNATLLQQGGISGVVDLSTDTPWATLEPKQVTTLPLTTQTLHAQGVSFNLKVNISPDAPLDQQTLNLIFSQNGREVNRQSVLLSIKNPFDFYANLSFSQTSPGKSLDLTYSLQTRVFSPIETPKIILENPPQGFTMADIVVACQPCQSNSYGGMSTITVAPPVIPGTYKLTLVATVNNVSLRKIFTVNVFPSKS